MNELYTYQRILEELLSAYEDYGGTRKDDASDAGIRMRVLAGQLFALHARITWLESQVFPDSAVGEQLDRLAAMWGIVRKEASCAEGQLCFSRPEAEIMPEIPLPAGVLCAAPGTGGKQFATIKDAVLPAGETQVCTLARALEPGASSNVAAGAVTLPINPPLGVTQVSNPSPFDGGTDTETDAHLRRRLLDRLGKMPNGANADTYREKALSYAAVLEASILPRARGAGTVDVVILTAEEAPQEALLAQMQAAFSQEREIGTDVLVRGAVRKRMNLSAKVLVESGYEPTQVTAQCEASLREFLETLPLGNQLLAAQIGDRLFHVEGVANYVLLSPAEDVLLSADVKLIPGTIQVAPMQ